MCEYLCVRLVTDHACEMRGSSQVHVAKASIVECDWLLMLLVVVAVAISERFRFLLAIWH